MARKEKISQRKFFSGLDSLTQLAKSTATQKQTISTLDSLIKSIGKLNPSEERDSIPIGQLVNFGAVNSESHIMISMDDVMMMSVDSLCEKYKVTSFKDKLMVKQGIRVMRSPSSFLSYLIGNILWMVLIMMPMLALVLKGVYFRQGFLYYEHLIFSFHVHTFLFMVSAILIPLQIWTGMDVASFGIPLSLLYPVFALKRFYGQNWWWTMVKGLLIGTLYIIIFALSFTLMSVASIFLF